MAHAQTASPFHPAAGATASHPAASAVVQPVTGAAAPADGALASLRWREQLRERALDARKDRNKGPERGFALSL